MGWMGLGWVGMVIIGLRLSNSTYGTIIINNNHTIISEYLIVRVQLFKQNTIRDGTNTLGYTLLIRCLTLFSLFILFKLLHTV